MSCFFTSDYHFFHHNILKYDSRPFSTIEEHDETIINNHNSLVSPEDDFYFLGDFCFNYKKTEQYLQMLNGNKFFIRGNHDKPDTIKLYEKYGTYLGELYSNLFINKQRIVLCHYSLTVWNQSHRGAWMLYGHSHHSLEDRGYKSIDVGINGWDYKPLSFEQIKRMMDKRPILSIDHHKEKDKEEV